MVYFGQTFRESEGINDLQKNKQNIAASRLFIELFFFKCQPKVKLICSPAVSGKKKSDCQNLLTGALNNVHLNKKDTHLKSQISTENVLASYREPRYLEPVCCSEVKPRASFPPGQFQDRRLILVSADKEPSLGQDNRFQTGAGPLLGPTDQTDDITG